MPNSRRSDGVDFLVLHALRCMGFTSSGRVGEALGIDDSDAESELIDLAVAGLVTTVRGEFGGWGLTEAGRAADDERSAAALDEAGGRGALTAAYESFLVLNPELLDLCSAWQMRSVDGATIANDHADKAYDARVVGRFADLNRRAAVVCGQMSAVLDRFERYPVRLTAALTRAEAGEVDYLTDNLSSFHLVWFQLHEDLLATLGIARH